MELLDQNYNRKEGAYLRAKEKVEQLKGFYYNLASYLVVIPFLIFINYMTSWNEYHWFWWPMVGWGLGVLIHGLYVFSHSTVFGAEWERRKIEQIMKEEKKENWH